MPFLIFLHPPACLVNVPNKMNYIVIFDVRVNVVNVVDIFHQLENYQSKLLYALG